MTIAGIAGVIHGNRPPPKDKLEVWQVQQPMWHFSAEGSFRSALTTGKTGVSWDSSKRQ